MPRYFFNVYDGVSLPDTDGTVLAGIKEAQEEAIRYAGSLISGNASTTKLGEDWLMEVVDPSGLILFRLDFHVSGIAANQQE